MGKVSEALELLFDRAYILHATTKKPLSENTDKKQQAISQAEHDIREAIMEELPKEKEVTEKYTGLSTGYFTEQDTMNIGYNQYRKEAIEAIRGNNQQSIGAGGR